MIDLLGVYKSNLIPENIFIFHDNLSTYLVNSPNGRRKERFHLLHQQMN